MTGRFIWAVVAALGLAAPAHAADGTHAVAVLQGPDRTLYDAWKFRPAQIGGAITSTSPAAGVTIGRDAYGVPIVLGDTLNLVQYGAGYVHAQDRLFQMDLLRHRARGRVAEMLGPAHVNADIAARRELPSERELARAHALLPKLYRDALQSYANGVNAAIAAARANPSLVPADYTLRGIPFVDWQPVDSVAVAVYLARRIGPSGGDELAAAGVLAALRARHGKQRGTSYWEDAYVRNDPAAPVTVPASSGSFAPVSAKDTGRGPDAPGVALPDGLPARIAVRTPASTLSSTVVVGLARSATGRPLLAATLDLGGEREHALAEIAVAGGGLNARGVTLPGLGGYALTGHSGTHAWALAGADTDQADVFAVRLCGGSERRYTYRRGCAPMLARAETIAAREGAQLVAKRKVTYLRTVHGPVIGFGSVAGKRVAFARRIAFAGREQDAIPAFFQLNRDGDLASFMRAASQVPFAADLSYAGGDGHVAFMRAGRVPLRARGTDDRLPVDGSGGYDWRGFQKLARNPQVVDPPAGWIASWNNKPSRRFGGGQGAIHRVQLLQARLAPVAPISFDGLVSILRAASVTDPRVAPVRPILLAAVTATGTTDPATTAAAATLAAWDGSRADANGDGRYDQPGVALMDEWWRRAQAAVLGPVYGAQLVSLGGDLDVRFGDGDRGGLFLRVLQGPAAPLPLAGRWPGGAQLQRTLTSALTQAARALQRTYGVSPASWLAPVATRPLAAAGDGARILVPATNRGLYEQLVELP